MSTICSRSLGLEVLSLLHQPQLLLCKHSRRESSPPPGPQSVPSLCLAAQLLGEISGHKRGTRSPEQVNAPVAQSLQW